MRINEKLRRIMKEEKFKSVDFGPVFGCTSSVAASRFYNGIATIYDLVRLMNFMGGEVVLRSRNGTEISLTIDDVQADKIERKTRYLKYSGKKTATGGERLQKNVVATGVLTDVGMK